MKVDCSRVTHPFATAFAMYCYIAKTVRLACLNHAASVHSEPGSNSQVEMPLQHLLDVEPSHICLHPKTQVFPFHVLMLSKQQEPTNREAFTLIIGPQGLPNFPTRPICKQSNADAPKPPAYPFITYSFKEQRHKTTQGASLLAFPEPPHIQNFPQLPETHAPVRHHLPAASTLKRRRRFGEAVSRPHRKIPQE